MEKKRFQKGKKNGGVVMPTKSNNTGGRGGARPGAGRKKKALVEKLDTDNPGGRPLMILDIPDFQGVETLLLNMRISWSLLMRFMRKRGIG